MARGALKLRRSRASALAERIHLAGGDSGPLPGLTLVVATHAELTRLGAPLNEVVHYENGVQVPGRSDEPWSTMAFFSDPTATPWITQQRQPPGTRIARREVGPQAHGRT
jgi:hypothetical protein